MKYFAWIGGGLLVLLGLLLPVQGLLDWGSRFSTVAGFRADYEKGLQVLRVALVLNGLLAAALPWLLPRLRCAEPVPDPRPERRPMAALFLLAAALIAPGMSSSFQQDEWRCLTTYAEPGPLVALTRCPDGDNHLLHSLLAWPMIKAFGLKEWPTRLPILILTALAPAVLFSLLRRTYGLWPSLLAAAPLAFSVHLVVWGQEGRAYGPLITCVLLLVRLQPRLLRGTLADWGWYVALGLATVMFQIMAALVLVGLALVGWKHRWRSLSALAVIGALSLLVYAMVLPQYFGASERNLADRTFQFHIGVVDLATGGFTGLLPPLLALPFAGALVLGLRDRGTRGILAAAAVSTALLWLLQQHSGASQSVRYYTSTIAMLWIVFGCGIASTFTACRPGGLITALALAGLSLAAVVDICRLGKSDYRRAAREFESRRASTESAALFFDCRPMNAYLAKPLPVLRAEELRSARPDWIWVVEGNLDRVPEFGRWLEEHYEPVVRLPSTSSEVRGYRKRPSVPP